MRTPTREEALDLLHEYTAGEGLRKHALAVEHVMRALARRYGEDEESWGLVGLLHDFDYERYPLEHPLTGSTILEKSGYPETIRHAILCHAPSVTGLEPESLMDKAILAVDELTGFITAVALVRPAKALADVSVEAVKKKLKDKSFARSVNRQEIDLGVKEFGVDLDNHIAFVIDALLPIANRLGL